MAQCQFTPQEFIQNAFAPQISILCSEDADNVCLKNNLRFVELLQPFTKQCAEGRISDPSGNTVTIKNFSVVFEDLNRRPPQPTLGKKILNEAISSSQWDQEVSKQILSWTGGPNLILNLHSKTPWFEEWREIFLQIQYPSDHEFTKHYIACIIVISAGSENPMEQLNKLSQYQHQQQHQNPSRFPKWFSPNILKYYVLVHDVDETEITRAEQVFEQMVSAYGASNCHHLHINSRSSHHSDVNLPDLWGHILERRRIIEGRTSVGMSGSSEASSGTETPKEDVTGMPSRVSEGNSGNDSAETVAHPLSPVAPPPDEKNGFVEAFPCDVPLLLNQQPFPTGIIHPQPYGTFLTPSDVDRIKIFVDDFCLRALIPHVERQIRHLSDVVTNRSRSKSLLSATRRWLGGSKSPTSGTNSVIYSQEATELQTRRLGDLCFMFGLYEQAYNAYYTAKNDFKNDQAWLYFAGAQEMAAMATFMHNQGEFPRRYSEGSLHTYLDVCKVYNFAIRLTLLSTEVLKHFGDFGEAAMMFIRMTSEESDLLSALMLEQAAYCFINSKRPLPRKYAFHMTLAGHRFSKAGQRKHSLRAYKQAFQVYFDRGWILAEDHIHYTMGKQAFQLKLNQESLEATTRLIAQGTKKSSSTQQSSTQQLSYMREFLNILDKYRKEEEAEYKADLVSFPVPILNGQNTKILLGEPLKRPEEEDWSAASHIEFTDEEFREKRWFALEREVVEVAQGHSMIFKPNLQRLTNFTPNTTSPFVPVKERVSVQVHLENPLLVSLTLSSLRPIYSYYDESGKKIEDDLSIIYETVNGFSMPPESEQVVKIDIWPQRLGKFSILGIAYKISLASDLISSAYPSNTVAVEVKQNIALKGPRLNNTLREKCEVVYARDERLNIKIIAEMPRLHVALKDVPAILSCGELQCAKISFTNVGPVPLSSLYLATSQPQNVFFSQNEMTKGIGEVNTKFVNHTNHHLSATRVENLTVPYDNQLKPGESFSGNLWIHAPTTPGTFDVELLFYYESLEQSNKKRYRLVRHLSNIYLYPSIQYKVRSSSSLSLVASEKESPPQHSINLVLNVQNKCQEIQDTCSSVELIGVGLCSPSYAVVIPCPLKELSAIEVNQRSQVCLQGSCFPQNDNNDSVVITYIPFSDHKVNDLLSCWWMFTLRERLKLPELSSEPPPPNPLTNYVPPPLSEIKIEEKKLRDSSVLDIATTLIWKSWRGNDEIYGQHTVFVEKLTEKAEQEEEQDLHRLDEGSPVRIFSREDSPVPFAVDGTVPPLSHMQNLIKVSVDYPKEILHNFKLESLCRIEFHIYFYNSCPCSLFLEVEFSSSPSLCLRGEQMQVFRREASLNLLSVGGSTRKFSLSGFGSRKVAVRSLVSFPGTYCLGTMALKVKRDAGSEWVPQVCQVQSVVVVRTVGQTVLDGYVDSELVSIRASSASS